MPQREENRVSLVLASEGPHLCRDSILGQEPGGPSPALEKLGSPAGALRLFYYYAQSTRLWRGLSPKYINPQAGSSFIYSVVKASPF